MNPRQFTVLIVSPDRPTLRRLSKFLEVFGFDVRQAAEPAQAVAAAEAAPPDFLLVDRAGQAELQLCRQVRRLASGSYTYSLLLMSHPEVSDLTEALEAGFDDFLTSPVVFGELLARLRAGARVIEFEQRLAEQSGVDAATGLPDKAWLAAELDRRLQLPKGKTGWLALFDLDYFGRLSLTFGRPASARLLRAAAGVLASQADDHHFFASLGEDRFVAFLPPGSRDNALAWVNKTLAALAQHPFEGQVSDDTGPTVKLTASSGLAELEAGSTVEAALSQVKRCIQLAKSSGGNCVCTPQDVDRETEQWAAFAASGKLFETTLARDVMTPCAMLLHVDEAIDQAHALMELTKLSAIPVVDQEGRLAGLVTAAQLADVRSRSSKPRSSGSSVRLLRHVMTTDFAKFDETTPLGALMEFFTGESAPLAIVVRDKRPKGMVYCQGLAALNERLTVTHFAAPTPRSRTSEDLLVPDLAMAE